jgi:hypothetical protein
MSAEHPVEVYRTTDPAIVAAWHEANEAVQQWRNKVGDFAESVTGHSAAWFNGFLDSQYCVGLVASEGATVPNGWRRHKNQPTRIVPDKRTKVGKQAARDFDGLGREPSVRSVLKGMPVTVRGEYLPSGAHKSHTFGLTAKVAGEITVHWGVEVPVDQVDSAIWRKVPLSAYHAEREAGAE